EGFAFEHVDECRILPDACRGDMRCVNQNGGYLCIPRSLYNQPYRPEAIPPEPTQVEHATSTQKGLGQGGFEPRLPHYNYINECETNSHHCNPTQLCINSEGGYTCSCAEGYWLLGGQCQVQKNLCMYLPSFTKEEQLHLCANIPGSYSCSCNPGFILNPDSRTCQDVDECADEPCSHGCFNTYGSYMCNCNEGFELASDGTTCIDLDECSFSDFLCQYRCVNTPGSFSCICPPAYYVHEDGRSCEGKKMSALAYHATSPFSGKTLHISYFLYFIPHTPLFVSVLFISQQTSNVSATLVLSRPIRGPKEVVLDLEMVTVNNVINFRGSSIIRLTIFVSEHPF
uniref:Fibulin 5 n=1 Tax=Amphilophus citrinellus TaxID=61819 RepID=A0A3Q0SI75_AMPCI